MKKLTITALVFGLLGSTAYAESAVNESQNLTLALSTQHTVSWFAPKAVKLANALANEVELANSKTMAKVSIDLNKQLEAKIARELEHVM